MEPQSINAKAINRWNRTSEKTPKEGVEVEITSPHFIGTRTARIRVGLGVCWELTDCANAMQNGYVVLAGSAWREIL